MNLLIVFILSVSLCILYALRIYFKNAIYTADDADRAVRLRREYSYARCVVLILAIAIVLVTISFDDFHLSAITCGFAIMWSGFFGNTALIVSSKRPADILPNEKFALYLRGFSFDNYEGIRYLQKQSQYKKFSEYHFFSILDKYMPVYSVGMTKELSAPLGATRIYLNDAEWEKEVQGLIQKAEMIIVLVNDSNSCIWEFEQCYKLKKTMLIVDDKDKIVSLRGYFASKHIYPFPVSLNSRTILYHNKEDYLQIIFENTEKSYRKVIKQFMKRKYGIRRWIVTSLQRKIFIGLLVLFLLPVIFIMTFAKISDTEKMFYVLIGIVVIIGLNILYSVPMSKWRKLKEVDVLS